MDNLFNKTIAFDFDGVINSYKNGWNNGVGNLTEPNIEVVEVIRKLKSHGANIIIFTTRCNDEYNRSLLLSYLRKNEIPFDEITDKKKPWLVLIDDRCIHYNENSRYNLLNLINNFL